MLEYVFVLRGATWEVLGAEWMAGGGSDDTTSSYRAEEFQLGYLRHVLLCFVAISGFKQNLGKSKMSISMLSKQCRKANPAKL